MMKVPMRLTYWLKDDFPDMLWLCYLCSVYEERGPIIANKLYETARDALVEEYGALEAVPKEILFNGRLTSFDTIPGDLRKVIRKRLEDSGAYTTLFPVEFSNMLDRYDAAPGEWLWQNKKPQEDLTDDDRRKAERLLKGIIEDSWSGYRDHSTWAKMSVMAAMFTMEQVKIAAGVAEELLDLLPKYPYNLKEDELKRVESSMRAMYQGMIMTREKSMEVTIQWARKFWRANWTLTQCETETDPSRLDEDERAALDRYRGAIIDEFGKHKKAFLEATNTDPDLYDPSRYEVLSGMVSRAIRSTEVIIKMPMMWSTEHGSGLIRSLVDTRIVLAWLILEDDPEQYDAFKDYGRGHLKLLKLHLEEYQDKQAAANSELEAYISSLDNEVNQDISEEFQDIRVGSTFANGKNTRQMADEVGLGDDYRFIFAPASSSVHNEWPAVDRFALERCLNPMHRGHRIVRKSNANALSPELVEFALDQLKDLIERYAAAITPSTS
jgi:hypothetical protein